ncbi:helix-turn-helix transcriptional regulator [Nocardia sp. BMG51109]|uniref:helix-turn-helix domain-containing protein n=1 Tax=Nocardia sp. BMG51109 TaxID=1056816 RepID=UPI0009FCC23A|nr:helix-turn-helix transcriptional regulator [Nocardia sp. BMG51109]
MGVDMFPGVKDPTPRDHLAVELADEQLNLVLGLRAVRVDSGMSISDVAEAMGVDPSQVSRFESGATNPTMSTVRRYAKVVGAIFRVTTSSWSEDRTNRVRAAVDAWVSSDPSSDEEYEQWTTKSRPLIRQAVDESR